MWETKNAEIMVNSHKFVLNSYDLKKNKISKKRNQLNQTEDGVKRNFDHSFYEIGSKIALFNDLIDTKLN